VERGGGGDSITGEGDRVTVGCAGWSSFRPAKFFGPEWRNRFSSVLNAYAHVFNFVEVNSTFYKLPKVETAKRWRSEAGDNFLFSVKAHRSITHDKRFRNVEEDVEKLMEVVKAMDAFFVLFQTPRSFRFSEENLKALLDFYELLPEGFTYGFELRGWSNEEVKMFLAKVNAVHVVDPFDREPVRGDPYYFRLHGSPPGERMYKYKYTDEDLRWLKGRVEELEGEVYVVFNNVWMCEDALRFKEILRSP